MLLLRCAGGMAAWLLAWGALSARGLDEDAIVAIVRHVALRYGKGCAVLLHSDAAPGPGLGKQRALADMVRRLSAAGVAATSLRVQATTSQQASQLCHEKAPTIVLWDPDNLTKRFVKEALSSRQELTAAWLLLPGAAYRDDARAFLEHVHVPFDRRFLAVRRAPGVGGGYLLHGLYRAAPAAELRSVPLGRWGGDAGGVLGTLHCFPHQRPQLHGVVLKSAYTRKEFVMEEFVDETGRNTKTGLFANFWKTLEETVNFTTEYQENKEGGYGMLNQGLWNGMVEMLRRNEVDVAVGDFTMSTSRQSVIDFTIPLLTTSFKVFIRARDRRELNWKSFTSPFSGKLWAWMLGCMPAVAALVWAASRTSLLISNRERPVRRCSSPSSALLSVLRPLCQQGHEYSPCSWSCRTIFLTLYVTSQVLYAAYSAYLVSSLTKGSIKLPFTDIKGLLEDGTYNFYITKMSAEYEMFQMSNDSLMRAMFNRYLVNQSALPTENSNSLLRLCSDSKNAVLQAGVLAVVSEGQLPCRVVALPTAVFQTSLAIAMAKCSPYRGIINYYLLKLLETGMSKKIRAQYSNTLEGSQQGDSWSEVDIVHVVPTLVVLVVGIMAANLVLLLELCLHKLRLWNAPPPAFPTPTGIIFAN